jgi:hypothetical protein
MSSGLKKGSSSLVGASLAIIAFLNPAPSKGLPFFDSHFDIFTQLFRSRGI